MAHDQNTHFFVPYRENDERVGRLYDFEFINSDKNNFQPIDIAKGFTVSLCSVFATKHESKLKFLSKHNELCVLSHSGDSGPARNGHTRLHLHGDYKYKEFIKTSSLIHRVSLDSLSPNNPKKYEVQIAMVELDHVWGSHARIHERKSRLEAADRALENSKPLLAAGVAAAGLPGGSTAANIIANSLKFLIRRDFDSDDTIINNNFTFELPSRAEAAAGTRRHKRQKRPVEGFYILTRDNVNIEDVCFNYAEKRLVKPNGRAYKETDFIVIEIQEEIFDGYTEPHLISGESSLDFSNRLFGLGQKKREIIEELNYFELQDLLLELVELRHAEGEREAAVSALRPPIPISSPSPSPSLVPSPPASPSPAPSPISSSSPPSPSPSPIPPTGLAPPRLLD